MGDEILMEETMAETQYFDPYETVRGIKQILVSDKKKIAFLFGAGTSVARRNDGDPFVPAVTRMTELVEEKVSEEKKFKIALEEIKSQLVSTAMGFNVETLLTNIEDKTRVIENDTLNGLSKREFEILATKIKDAIRDIVGVHKQIASDRVTSLVQYDFGRWIKSADRKCSVEIFTTNYDYLLEMGLEAADVPYYDGFTGSYMPFFNSDSLEDMNFLLRQTKLWKIHGSLGLHEDVIDTKRKIIRKGSDSDDLLIYPSAYKYSNSKKMPYVAFMDRLNDFLKQDDAVLFVCGYSFADEHINERIISALNTSSTSHVFVFYYDIEWIGDEKQYALTEDCKLAQIAKSNRRISVLGCRNAVIGALYGLWKLKREPDREDSLNTQSYFDEDAPINPFVELNNEQHGDEAWTGEGELILPDFTRFVDFLKYMISNTEWEDNANG
jgi:hypothetical protein